MVNHYHLQNIRALLNEGFTVRELRQLCRDVPPLSIICNSLPPNTNKLALVDFLLERAERASEIETILTWAQERNPARYHTHNPYHHFQYNPMARKLNKIQRWVKVNSTDKAQYPWFWATLFLIGTMGILGVGFGLFIIVFS